MLPGSQQQKQKYSERNIVLWAAKKDEPNELCVNMNPANGLCVIE